MKTTILTLSTLAFLSTTIFAETKPNVPAKEASQIFKAAGFSKPNMAGKVAATQVKSPHTKTSMVTV
jgi:hypothetical protein